MSEHFVRETFDRWLAHSAERFHHPPRVVLHRKRRRKRTWRKRFMLQFSGITSNLWGYIHAWGMVEIRVVYQRRWWDILTDFDISERRTSTGQYHCQLCTAPEMFPSRAALWVTHSFEPLLTWTNEHFQSSQWLCLFGDREGSTWAELTPAEDVPATRLRKYFVDACPVMRGRPSVTSGA